MQPTRLNKFISDTGFCSRREADKLIEQGRVTVNGKYPDAGTIVTEKDKVRIDDELLRSKEEARVFLVFNKPAGIAATTDLSVKNNVIHALNYPAALLPVGYIDRDSEGIMFLSNDTELVNKMTKYDTQYEKEYIVTVNKTLTTGFLAKVAERNGADQTGELRTNYVVKEGPSRFRIVLEPGMSHHIKKMCEDLGYRVVHLQRVRVHEFSTAKLPVRTWRVLTKEEIDSLKRVVAGKSAKTEAKAAKYGLNCYTRPGVSAGKRTSGSSAASTDKSARQTAAKGPKRTATGPAKSKDTKHTSATGPAARKTTLKKSDSPVRKKSSDPKKATGPKTAPKRGR